MTKARYFAWFLATLALAAPCVHAAAPDPAAATDSTATAKAGAEKPADAVSLVHFFKKGGTVGYAIVLLGFIGLALVIDCILRITSGKLVPPALARQVVALAREARLGEIVRLSRESDSLLGRVLRKVMAQRPLSLASAREALQEEGAREIVRLQHRVGYIGFIATIAPMLGLLGTAAGVISSLNVLGTSGEDPRPADMVMGVSEALVTTCEGLIVAIPLLFFHLFFRVRVTRIGHEAAGVCDGVMRGLAAVVEARTTGRPAQDDLEAVAAGEPESKVVAEGQRIQGGGAERPNPDNPAEKIERPKA
jgi:biopolymer transport protein ExbB